MKRQRIDKWTSTNRWLKWNVNEIKYQCISSTANIDLNKNIQLISRKLQEIILILDFFKNEKFQQQVSLHNYKLDDEKAIHEK